jgi:hypothetical protein
VRSEGWEARVEELDGHVAAVERGAGAPARVHG